MTGGNWEYLLRKMQRESEKGQSDIGRPRPNLPSLTEQLFLEGSPKDAEDCASSIRAKERKASAEDNKR